MTQQKELQDMDCQRYFYIYQSIDRMVLEQ